MDGMDNPDATLKDLNSEYTPTPKGVDVAMKWVPENTISDWSNPGSEPAKNKYKFNMKEELTPKLSMPMG